MSSLRIVLEGGLIRFILQALGLAPHIEERVSFKKLLGFFWGEISYDCGKAFAVAWRIGLASAATDPSLLVRCLAG